MVASKRAQPAPQHLICTDPKPGSCRKCHGRILVCYSYGEPVKLADVHLNSKGEAIARIAGWGTYQAGDTRDGGCRKRNIGMIRQHMPIGGRIYVDHVCGLSWQPDCVEPPEVTTPQTTLATADYPPSNAKQQTTPPF
jgi:hypothetical protein